MRNIHCPKDIGLNNIFIGEDCKEETGEVYDTEIPVSCKADIKYLFDKLEKYKTEMNL